VENEEPRFRQLNVIGLQAAGVAGRLKAATTSVVSGDYCFGAGKVNCASSTLALCFTSVNLRVELKFVSR
jgi:hypothetical protein